MDSMIQYMPVIKALIALGLAYALYIAYKKRKRKTAIAIALSIVVLAVYTPFKLTIDDKPLQRMDSNIAYSQAEKKVERKIDTPRPSFDKSLENFDEKVNKEKAIINAEIKDSTSK